MRVAALHSTKDLDYLLASAFIDGVRAHGDDGVIVSANLDDGLVECDAVMLFGVKSRLRFDAYRAAGVQTIILDKGYVRTLVPGAKRCEYWRTSVNAHHPTGYLGKFKDPADRWDRFGIELRPWRTAGGAILIAGSSEKYHAFNGLPHPTLYAEAVIGELKRLSSRSIIYRPKPSWREATEIVGADWAGREKRLFDVLPGIHALVTNGSNSCFEAVLAGVPCIVLGDAVARPISSTDLDRIETPYLASERERRRWLCSLAYCQFTEPELRSGEAWPYIRRHLAEPVR